MEKLDQPLLCSYCLCCCCFMFSLWVPATVAGVPAECCWLLYCLFWRFYCWWHPWCCCRPCCCCHLWDKHHSCFWCHPYCVGGPVITFIPAVAFLAFLLLWAVMIAVILACCCRYCCWLRRHCCCLHPNCGRYTCCCLHPNCGRYSCCYWRPFSSWWITVAGLPAIAGIPGVARVCEVHFELAIAGGPAVICFPAVDGILTVASIPADPRVPILAGGFTYWTVQWDILLDYRTIGQWLSDCYFLLLSDHRNIKYRIGEFKKLSDYRISDLGLNLSDYRISVAHLWQIHSPFSNLPVYICTQWVLP